MDIGVIFSSSMRNEGVKENKLSEAVHKVVSGPCGR